MRGHDNTCQKQALLKKLDECEIVSAKTKYESSSAERVPGVVFWEASMRVCSRIALVVILISGLAAPAVFAQRLIADCPLEYVASNPAPTSSSFLQSPHGVFRSGTQAFVLRGQTLTTYTINDVGDLQPAREDVITSLGARDVKGGVAFANNHLFISGEAGLEIYNLTNVRPGGSAPLLVSRTPGLRYHRIVISGNTLVGLYPATDLPCYPNGTTTCATMIDMISIANLAAPTRVGILSSVGSFILGFNDVAFVGGLLAATGPGGTFLYNISTPSNPRGIIFDGTPGTFLVTNGTSILAVGNEQSVETFVLTNSNTALTPIAIHNIAELKVERSNPIAFHPQGSIDETNGRLILMVDEIDPQTLNPARTLAFDVFDYTVPFYLGSDPKPNESVSYTRGDEVKYNPVAIGPYVYVIGEMSGLQTYGACGQMTGRIEFDSLLSLNCGGSEIRGWVTGSQRVANVELFIDNTPLSSPPVIPNGPARADISSRTPVYTWRVAVNLDQTAKGLHTLRAIGTDANGNRRQFASTSVFFPGPGQNCSNRRRTAAVH